MTKKELILWFIRNETDLVLQMQDTFHGYGNGVLDNPYHLEGSIWRHTVMVMSKAEEYFPDDEDILIAALLHDIGKVKTVKDNPDNQRRSFSNHEALSVFMAGSILDKLVPEYRKLRILRIIGLHGRLYQYIGDPGSITKVAKIFENEIDTFDDLKKFYLCDHEGRITDESVKDDIDVAAKWFSEVQMYIAMQKYDKNQVKKDKYIRVLVGLPRAGKSTYLENRCWTPEDAPVIISRDNILLSKGTGTYSEIWKSLSDEDQKDIDKELQSKFNAAVKAGRNIVIDMTNMSKKSRAKWVNPCRQKGYRTECIVFSTDIDTCNSRNTSDKNIPYAVLESMAKRFVVPLYDEFDEVHWV